MKTRSQLLVSASQVASSPVVEQTETASAYSDDGEEEGPVCFVLQERSGYMEPSLHFLAVAHTVISFFCMFGYYCLKVPWARLQLLKVFNELKWIVEEQKVQLSTDQRGSITRASLDRYRWWFSSVRKKLRESWSLMACMFPSSPLRRTSKGSGTDWLLTHRMFSSAQTSPYFSQVSALSMEFFTFFFSRSFPSNYWDKFVKRKVSFSQCVAAVHF